MSNTETPLYAHNRRAAGMHSGCLAYALAAAIVIALLALPGVIMALLGIVTGGAK